MNKKVVFIVMAFLMLAAFSIAVVMTDLEKRNQNRAFHTAPPIVPHEIEDEDACLDCHAEHMEIEDGVYANATPHPHLSQCVQCHPGSSPAFGEYDDPVESEFAGLEFPNIEQADDNVTPPVIPHGLNLRDNCTVCHSADHPVKELRCDHLERTQCMTCHPLVK